MPCAWRAMSNGVGHGIVQGFGARDKGLRQSKVCALVAMGGDGRRSGRRPGEGVSGESVRSWWVPQSAEASAEIGGAGGGIYIEFGE
jgi:hypothetical protein